MQFDVKNNNGRFTLRLTVTETATSVASNTSTLSYSLKLIANTSYHFAGYKIGYTVNLNGKTVASLARADSESLSIAANGTLTLCSGTYTVTHNSDGSLEDMPVAWSIDMASADYTPGSLSGSGTMDLTTIPRASTIAAANANIGETSTITVNRKSTSFSHSIAYKFGSLSGYIKADGSISAAETKITATSIGFAVPTAFYAQIPDAKSGKCTLTIRTYSGTTQIGDAQTCNFTVTAPQSACKPAVSGTVVDANDTTIALTGDANKLVRYFSDALCTITAQPKNGASIVSKSINGTAVDGDALTIAGVDTGKIAFSSTDSRGYTTAVTVSKTLVAYIRLTAAVTCTRDDQTSGNATLYVTGNCFRGSFGAAANEITIQYRVGSGSWITADADTISYTGAGYAASIPLSDLDYQQSFNIYVTVSDRLMSVSKTAPLEKGVPAADWGEDDWRFNVPVYLGKINLQTLLEAMTTSCTLNTTAEAGTNWTVDGASAVLIGNNLRIYLSAARASAVDGNIANETVCTLTIDTGGRIKSAFKVGFCSSDAGGVSTFAAVPAVSGDMLTLTITLAATATAVTDTSAHFLVPVLLNLCDREITCVVDSSGVLRVYVEGVEVEAVVDSTGDLTWPGLVPKIYSNGAMQLREG